MDIYVIHTDNLKYSIPNLEKYEKNESDWLISLKLSHIGKFTKK